MSKQLIDAPDRSVQAAKSLRQRAEQKVRDEPAVEEEVASLEAARVLLHEFRVHQIELEMQNEELRLTQQALEVSRTRYSNLYDLAPVGYLTLTEDGRIRELNLTAAHLLGVVRSALQDQPLSRCVTRKSQDSFYLFKKRLASSGKRSICKLQMLLGDGSQFWARLEGIAGRDENNGALLFHLSMSDISAQRLASIALQESQARYKLAMDALNGGLWDWDLATNKIFYSPEWKRQIGYAADELSGDCEVLKSRLHPDDRGRVLPVMLECLAGSRPGFELEYRLLHKDGSYRWLQSRAALLRNDEEQPYRLIGMNTDITQQKQAMALNQHRLEMEESNRIHIAMHTAAAIAHELNQPLTAMAFYSEVALLHLQNSQPNLETLTGIMEKNALQSERAGRVVRQLLSVLQRGEPEREAVDINSVILGALDLIKAEGNFGDIRISTSLPPDLPKALANALQVEKVLINLLHNALEAVQESGLGEGTIHVSAGTLAVGEHTMLHITVCDGGKILDEEATKQIFQPFYTTKPGGLSMGLVISRALIEAHGGKLWAERNPDRGLSVHFTLPIDEGTAVRQRL